jgi:hypothetical protein
MPSFSDQKVLPTESGLYYLSKYFPLPHFAYFSPFVDGYQKSQRRLCPMHALIYFLHI